MHNRLQVEGRPDLVRDPESGAIINTNREELNAYLRQQEQKRKEAERLEKLEADMDEIKQLLKLLINKE